MTYIISYLISGTFGATVKASVSVLTDCQGLAECQQENSTLREAIQIHERFLLCQDVYDPLFKKLIPRR